MTHEELRQAAIDFLGQAFKGEVRTEPHVVAAAVTITLNPIKDKAKSA